MAIVAGLVFWLREQSFQSGKIVLLFQPAEETGQGAAAVVRDEKFRQLDTDYVFAVHNIPKEPLHSIITMDQGFSAEVQSFILSVVGKESHAAEPEHGMNPALGIAEIIAALSQLNIHDPLEEDFAVLTPVHMNMGHKSYGISPGKGELHYTIRTWSTEKMAALKVKIEQLIERSCQAQQLAYTIDWLEYFPASSNDPQGNNYLKAAAKENAYAIIERPYPFKFGEDFGWFSKKYKTAMFGLGAGVESPALHHADYDFPDDIIETGINMFKTIIKHVLDPQTGL
jgi:amidohydrolase